LAAIQKTPVIQKEVMDETIITAVGSCDGTCGTSTSRINKKKNTESTKFSTTPFLEKRVCSASLLIGVNMA